MSTQIVKWKPSEGDVGLCSIYIYIETLLNSVINYRKITCVYGIFP